MPSPIYFGSYANTPESIKIVQIARQVLPAGTQVSLNAQRQPLIFTENLLIGDWTGASDNVANQQAMQAAADAAGKPVTGIVFMKNIIMGRRVEAFFDEIANRVVNLLFKDKAKTYNIPSSVPGYKGAALRVETVYPRLATS